MITDRSQIREGMAVYSSDGEKLGKVLSCDASTFTIEKGFFFPKDYLARFEDVSDITGDDIRLAMTKDTFVSLRERGEYRSTEGSAGGTFASGATTRAGSESRSVPVTEEELDVVKRDRQAGEVRLRKDVVTETKHVDVPVTREEVRVERVPVTGEREARPGERAFEGESVSMPIREEEVEVRKRPVVKEEVRLRKDRITEQRAAEADVRKERVEVEGDEAGRIRRDDESGATRGTMNEPYPGIPGRDDELP